VRKVTAVRLACLDDKGSVVSREKLVRVVTAELLALQAGSAALALLAGLVPSDPPGRLEYQEHKDYLALPVNLSVILLAFSESKGLNE